MYLVEFSDFSIYESFFQVEMGYQRVKSTNIFTTLNEQNPSLPTVSLIGYAIPWICKLK